MEKEYILAEVRRCAEANGGRALGRERFERETGIRETDWAGKYWVNWNEVIQDAGLAPNRMNTALPDEVLLQAMADLVKELGRYPVQNEIKMAWRAKSGFPSPTTFRRLGGKAALAERVLEHCAGREGYDEVVQRCRAVIEQARSSASATEDRPPELSPGYVYLVKSGRYYKIGRTSALGRREYELALQLPERLTLVHAIETDDMAGIERYWHDRFAGRRANGEWFSLTPTDVRSFKRRRFM